MTIILPREGLATCNDLINEVMIYCDEGDIYSSLPCSLAIYTSRHTYTYSSRLLVY